MGFSQYVTTQNGDGGFGKEVCFSDESQYPYEDSCDSLSHPCQGKGARLPYIPLATMYG